MCLGGGSKSSGPAHTTLSDASGNSYYVEDGVPLEYAQRGASTVTQYQTMANQDISDKQLSAQKAIADEQDAYNRDQLKQQAEQQAAAEKASQEQAARQSAYDTGRATNLSEGTKAISDAFAGFGDEYFNKYANDYMAQIGDQVGYQQDLATKSNAYDMARAGLVDSQANANQLGLISETAGRTMADETKNAQSGANALRSSIAGEKSNLLSQLTASESIGSPIAGSTMDDVNQSLQTQRSSISGIASNANDVVASTQAVPTVSTLGNIFSGIVGSTGSYLGGTQANTAATNYSRALQGLTGTSPSASSGSKR